VPDFGAVVIGSAPARAVTVSNSGQATATLSDIALAGPDAQHFTLATDCGPALSGGATCTATVRFRPLTSGAKTAALRVTDSTPGSPHSAALSGTGLTPAQIVLDPVPVPDFGPVPVGTGADPKSVSIANTGQAAATITGIEVVGIDAGDFGVAHDCPGTLPGGASCTAFIGFTPSFGGARSAALSVAGDTAGAPHLSGLSGTGRTKDAAPPAMKLSGTSTTAPSKTTLVEKGMEVPFTASEPGTYDVSLELLKASKATAAAVKRIVLGKTRRVLKQAGPLRVRVRLSKSGKRALRRAKRPQLRVVIVGRDAAGNISRVTRLLRRR
jgi:hypothetical protein